MSKRTLALTGVKRPRRHDRPLGHLDGRLGLVVVIVAKPAPACVRDVGRQACERLGAGHTASLCTIVPVQQRDSQCMVLSSAMPQVW